MSNYRERLEKMTDDELSVECAKAMGWTELHIPDGYRPMGLTPNGFSHRYARFAIDANAMLEWVEWLEEQGYRVELTIGQGRRRAMVEKIDGTALYLPASDREECSADILPRATAIAGLLALAEQEASNA